VVGRKRGFAANLFLPPIGNRKQVMSRIILCIAGIGLSAITYNAGYNAALSEISADRIDASYESLIEKVTKEEIKLSDPVPKMFLENWAEGYYD
jgi:hypothetical protein